MLTTNVVILMFTKYFQLSAFWTHNSIIFLAPVS